MSHRSQKALSEDSTELLQREIHQEVIWVYPHLLELDPMRL